MTRSDRYRVVIADDVEALRGLLRLVLERDGRFEVVGEARNGRDAVTVTTEQQPDLTLLDLSMPIMDGLEALPLIRDAVPSCTVVVLSGFDADRMERRALGAGASAYLVKGIPPQELVSRLLELLHDPSDPPTGNHDARDGMRASAIELPAALDSAGLARRFVRDTLRRWSCVHVVDEAMLLTTELVSNAVVHAHSAVHVRVSDLPDRVRVEITDFGGGALEFKPPSLDAVGGRGLLLVQEMSRSWGTSADGNEKVVWFEL